VLCRFNRFKFMQSSPYAFILAGLFAGVVSAFFAYRTERNPYLWFVLGFVFGIFGVFAFFFASRKEKPQQQKIPVFAIRGPKDKFWYYLDHTNQQQGPMSHDALSRIWKQGKIHFSTYVWHEDLKEW